MSLTTIRPRATFTLKQEREAERDTKKQENS